KCYFFDMSNADPHQPLVGHYVVLALLDDQPSPFETEVAGFWEVVPQSARFPTVTALRDAVLSDNPAENFPQLLPGGLGMSTGTFQYRMAMSGETLTIFRPQNVFRSSIIEIRAADGTEVPLTEHGFGHRSCNGGEPCEDDAFDLPLIDAWQVDCDYNFTGKVLAHAPGDGTLTVRNPYTAQILHIDSSDISNPTWSLEADPNNADYGPHSCESTPGCSVDSDCDAAANEFCDAGTCRTRPCNPASPFGSISEVLPGNTSTDGFALSADGRKAFFSRKAPGATNYDLYFAERPDTTSPFGQLQPVEGPVNSALDERAPFLSADQLRLYYWTKNTGNSNSDLKVATRTLPSGPFLSADVVGGVNNNVNSPVSDEDPYFIDGEGTLYFTSDRPTGERHIYVTTKQSNGLFSAPQPVQNLASYAEDRRPIVSRDGLTIFFGSQREGWNGDNDGDIFFSQRSNPGAEFQQPANLGALNHSGVDFPVALSADGCSLYFASNRRHGASGTQTFELYQAHRQTEPSSVTIVMNVTGTGTGSVLAPYSCAIGGGGTCAVTRPFGTLLTINATRPVYWSGACVANGQPGLSTDGVVQYDLGGTCNVTFPPP
ncbi:MAG TPA: hypothetical protein VGK73_26275, partial [Polyangiaceae bacterium]